MTTRTRYSLRPMRALGILLFGLVQPLLSTAQTLPVLTYNIRYANEHDRKNGWELRKDALASTVLENKPMIIGLQEALREQLAYLKSRWTDYDVFGVGRDDGFEGGEFAPIFYDKSAFDLLEGRTVWLSPTPDRPSKGWDATCNRIVTLVILRERSSGDSLWIANTHWDAEGKEARHQSARIVCDLLAGPIARGRRAIFMGDLNSKAHEEPVGQLREHLTDSCPKGKRCRGTFNGFNRLPLFSKRIDYVWLSPGDWGVEQYRVPRPKVGCRQVSDHFPVVVGLLRK